MSTSQLHGELYSNEMNSTPSHTLGGAPSVSILSQPGPYPLPAYLKALGQIIHTEAQRELSAHLQTQVTPLLCAFIARCLILEADEVGQSRDESSIYPVLPSGSSTSTAVSGSSGNTNSNSTQLFIHLTKEQEASLIHSTLHRLQQLDDPVVETCKMQVAFESFYATEVQKKRTKNFLLDQENSQQLNKILEIGTNIQSNAQVASLYRAIFKLMLQNGCVDTSKPDRNVDREIAAALESVFPQAGLNSFNMMSNQEKKLQILNLINIVLGIRLFNREIQKGGAGLEDLLHLSSSEVELLYETFEKESTALGDVCFTYSDVLSLEYSKPGTISASVLRLQGELLNRRQYILLIHQLQHEVLESLDNIKESRMKFTELCAELKTLVGLRTSVPKEQVYPKFQTLSILWRNLEHERDTNRMRREIFEKVLVKFRQSFTSNLLEEDIDLVKKNDKKDLTTASARTKKAVDFDEFVETITGPSHSSGTNSNGFAGEEKHHDASSAAVATSSYRPVRLVKEYTPNFMSLPLEFQGYCPWSIVHRGGLLVPGNPTLGIIRVLGRHYSFTSIESMQDFCEDTEKYVEGVLTEAKKIPALIHLLCLQPYIPHSDISEFFAMHDMLLENHSATSTQKANAGCQTPHYINTTLPDPNYHWNEWDLRRQAIQMADLTKKKTVSSQTNLSHFRRDNHTQYTLPRQLDDGSMDGKGTQTGIEKSSQVERVYRYHAGLRGTPSSASGPGTQMRVVELKIPSHVEDSTNGDLKLKPNESLKTYIVRNRTEK